MDILSFKNFPMPFSTILYPFQGTYKLSALSINRAVSRTRSIFLPITVALCMSLIPSSLFIALAMSVALSILFPIFMICPEPAGRKGMAAKAISTPNATQFSQSLYPPPIKSHIPHEIKPISNIVSIIFPVGSLNITGLLEQYAYILNPIISPLAFTYPSAFKNRPIAHPSSHIPSYISIYLTAETSQEKSLSMARRRRAANSSGYFSKRERAASVRSSSSEAS